MLDHVRNATSESVDLSGRAGLGRDSGDGLAPRLLLERIVRRSVLPYLGYANFSIGSNQSEISVTFQMD